MLALAGHLSRAMLERYSHIRMQAKREAVEALTLPKFSEVAKETAKVGLKTTKKTATHIRR